MGISIRFFSFILFIAISTLLQGAPDLVPAPPNVPSRSYLLMDFNSGKVLAEHKPDERMETASLTKIMTAYVVFHEIKKGNIHLDDNVRISEKAWRMKGSRMFIEVNSLVSVNNLLKGLIIQSGNDASIALSEHVAGNEDTFVTMMNKHAENLGMLTTHFTNSTGWPQADHYSTARDLATLTRALIHDFPDRYNWYGTKEYTYNGIRQPNRNRLLWLDERVDGVKTGLTESAGHCLITSAVQKNMRLISVVLGANSDSGRISASRKLINYGFRFFNTFQLYPANERLTTMRLWKGDNKNVSLGLSEKLHITVPRGQQDRIKASMTVDTTIMAPVYKGQQYGTVDVKLHDKPLTSQPLVALNDIPEGGLWRRVVDTVILLFK